MLVSMYKHPWLAYTLSICAGSLLFTCPSPERGLVQRSESSASDETAYFPPGAVDGFADYFSGYLKSIGEPSLLAAAPDRTAVAYRLDWMSGSKGYLLAVRVALNSDRSASLVATEERGAQAGPARTKRSISELDLRRFLKLVDKADFWSMPSVEPDQSGPARKSYKLDASIWVFEAVRDGNYHVVLRRAPERSSFTDMVRFLTMDLAKLDQSASPHATSAPSVNTSREGVP